MSGVWVFAYGSLMWNPGFRALRTEPARLRGYRRRLCISSHHYRGTPEAPGLVLGLDRGGSCIGRLLEVAPAAEKEVLAYLDAREQPTLVYERRKLPVERLADGTRVEAWTYVVRRDHPQYAGDLPFAEQVRRVAFARGGAGPCLDYVRNTIRHLHEMGVCEPELERILEEAERLATAAPPASGAALVTPGIRRQS